MFANPTLNTFFRFALTTMLVLCANMAMACPTCKNGILSSGGNLAGAYQASILFMMAMPFLLLGGFSAYMYWEVCKARKEQAKGSPKDRAPSR